MTTAKVCENLQSLQRERAIIIKSRIMQHNRLVAVVAGTLGYCSGLPEKERRKKFAEAGVLIKAVMNDDASHKLANVIKTTMLGIEAFDEFQHNLEKRMKAQATKLPVAAWVSRREQRGFGLLFLAIVVGEAGDLSNYANPGKLWRRLGCAPWTFDGKTRMGATWRGGKEGKLPADQWAAFGYSPRRRSIAYLIGEGIVKQNGTLREEEGEGFRETENRTATSSRNGRKRGRVDGDGKNVTEGEVAVLAPACGPYRARYDEAKAKAHEAHSDWSDLRCHRHGMLLATKRLLRELWVEWHKAAITSL